MRRMDLHAFHGSRHCWHDCHAVERHVECVSVRILKVTAAHRSSCRPRDTRRRLKTFFGTFLRPRNASRARDSLSLSLSALTALHLLVFSSKSTSNLFEGSRQKSSRENGRKKGDCAKNVQKICEEDTKYPKSTLMIFEWNKFLFHNFIYFYREDIRSTETTRSRYMENFHRMEENFKYWREIFEHFRVTGGHPLGT